MGGRIAIALVALVLSGCAGDSKEVAESELSAVVLQPDDVSGAFERFDEGRQAKADQPEGERADTARFGRVEGWKSRYRRRVGAEVRGPLVIESRADLFDSGSGAEDELDAIAGEQGVEAIDRGIGETAVIASTTQAGFPRRLRTFVVSWRSSNVVAAVTVNGFEGRVSETDALRLARRQQARIVAASG